MLLSLHSLPVKAWTETKCPIYNLKHKAKGAEYSQQNARYALEKDIKSHSLKHITFLLEVVEMKQSKQEEGRWMGEA